MGKGKKVTTGYHYRPAWHDGLCLGLLDAYLEFRPGTKTAWAGRITESTTININQPELWGGKKDQGGVVGPLAVMFGDADQLPNAYLTSVFGNQTVAWRGIATVAFEGGRYGANNPFPQKRAHKVERIKQGWDAGCWYEAKAAVPMFDGLVQMLGPGWEYKVETFTEPNTAWNDFTVPTDGWLQAGELPITTDGTGGGPYWTSMRSNLWLRRTMQVSSAGLTLNIGADNGCVVWANGVQVGTSNPTNANISNNQRNPVSFDMSATGRVDVVVKAFAEINAANDSGNIVDLSFTGVPMYAENPAHAIVWAHTQQHCGGMPLETVNSASAQAAADWYYAQGFGICTVRYPDKESAAEFIRRIERVAGCSFSQNRADGQWYIDIANGEYDIDSLPILTDDDIVSFEEVPSVLDDAVNSVSVKYFDPQRKEAITTPPLRAMGLIADFGTIHQTFDFPELPTDALANRVANRELLARCTPTRVFSLVTTRKTAGWRRNTYFRLQLPKRGIADMVCLLAEVNGGSLKSGAVQIKATQDIYSLPTTVYTETEPGVDTRPPQTPVPATAQLAFEAPHVDVVAALSRADFAALPEDAGFAIAAAANPGDMLEFDMQVDAGPGYASVATGEFCPSATLVAELPPGQQTAIAVLGAASLGNVEIGSACVIGGEWCRVDAIDVGAGTVDLGRGCADTLPAKHNPGARIYFYAAESASDTTEYIDGEMIDVKLLPRTGSQQLAEADAVALPLTFAARLAREYPPAQLQLNGVSIHDVASTTVVSGIAFDGAP